MLCDVKHPMHYATHKSSMTSTAIQPINNCKYWQIILRQLKSSIHYQFTNYDPCTKLLTG